MQVSSNYIGYLAEHKKAVDEGGKLPCRHCNYQVSSKGDLAKHKWAVHEEVKYSCAHYGLQFSERGRLA